MPLRPGVTKDQALAVLGELKLLGDQLWQGPPPPPPPPPVSQGDAEGYYLNVKFELLLIYTATSPELRDLDESFWKTIASAPADLFRYTNAVRQVTLVLGEQILVLQSLPIME